MAAQLPLDISGTPSFSRDDIVVTGTNAAAFAFVDGWPDWPAPVAMLVGPEGSGKSHLGRVWCEASGAIELAADDLMVADFAEPSDYFLEDLDRSAINETVLFHLINAVRQSGHNLLLTSRLDAGALPVALPDLASRLRAASTVSLAEPDDQLLEGVLRKLLADRQLAVDETTIQYLVLRMERSLAAAGKLVAEMDKLALVEKRAITRPLAARVLEALSAG